MALKLKETVKFEQVSDSSWLLDVKGYGCPHVQIYAEKALKKLASGNELTLVFDNPSSGESITYLCTANGDTLVERNEEGGTFTWKIRRA
jgi:tRNA 2-thiouridine synthesizing protein A